MSFTSIDLSKLSAPDVVETLDYKNILAEMLNQLRQIDPAFTALVESDPAIKILEVCAYREMLLRQRVNDAARGVMLAFASGADLDHLGALFGVARKEIRPVNLQSLPPLQAVLESDQDFRNRITLALEGLSTAGPEGSYIFHALKHSQVRDVSVVGPPKVSPGQVLVTILGHSGDGSVTDKTVEEVKALLNAEHVRPITDEVIVKSAKIRRYNIEAELFTDGGPDSSVVVEKARDRIKRFTTENYRIGRDISISGIYAALHVDGVQRVFLKAPTDTIVIDHTETAFCAEPLVTYGGSEK
jgi:phage-related baseplate assembly protein